MGLCTLGIKLPSFLVYVDKIKVSEDEAGTILQRVLYHLQTVALDNELKMYLALLSVLNSIPTSNWRGSEYYIVFPEVSSEKKLYRS